MGLVVVASMPVELIHEPGVETRGLEVVAGTDPGGAEGSIEEAADLFDVGTTDEGVEGGREDSVDEEDEISRRLMLDRFLLQQIRQLNRLQQLLPGCLQVRVRALYRGRGER